MANHPAPALTLHDGDREVLESWTRSASVRASAAKRARIVLLAANGESNQRIAELVDASRTTVIAWRERYLERGLDGLSDRDRPGRPRELDQDAIIVATLTPPPKSLGVMHWSTRLLAARIKVSPAAVARAWRAYGIKAESFRFSTAPELVGKVTDICGLYLNPPGTRSCSASTRSRRSRPWSARCRSCRCNPGGSNAAPVTTTGTAPPRPLAGVSEMFCVNPPHGRITGHGEHEEAAAA